MSTETLEIRQLARQFAESDLRPHVERWDHDGTIDDDVIAQLAELGFFGMLVPESHGGMAFDLPTYVAALEEIAWGEPAVALVLASTSTVADLIVRYGSPSQKHQWLEAVARGEAACLAIAEAGGPDVQDLTTTARQADGQWLLRGTKKWVANGRQAKLAAIAARAEDGVALFLTSTGATGYNAAGRDSTLGFRPIEIGTVSLDELALDAGDRISVPEAELAASVTGLLGTAAISIGIAQAALDHARGYADVREQFGTRLREFEGLQFKLADMAMHVEAGRALLQKVAAAPSRSGAAMVKVLASEGAMWVTTQAVQVFGGYGYMRDYPVEKLMRDAKATELLQAANEQLRVLIARGLYE